MATKQVALVIADISGYTRFVRYHSMAVLHAERIIADLLESVISAAEFPLSIGRLEGDAVFFYAETPQGNERAFLRDIIKQVQGFFEAFKVKEQHLMSCPVCICEACNNVGRLRLKAILHYGQAAMRNIGGHSDIGGDDVSFARELLKNTIPTHEYVLMTDAFSQTLGSTADLFDSDLQARTEHTELFGDTPVKVYYPNGDTPESPTEEVTMKPLQLTTLARIRQYARVNAYAVLRLFKLRREQNYLNLPR